MKAFIAAVLVVVSAAANYAQPVSVEEAQSRLREKAARAASQPTTDSSDTIRVLENMRSQLAALKQENAELKAEIKALKGKAAIASLKAAEKASIELGMSREDADAIYKQRKWERNETSTISRNIKSEVWTNPQAKIHASDFGGQQSDLTHMSGSSSGYDQAVRQSNCPQRVYLENGVVTRVDK